MNWKFVRKIRGPRTRELGEQGITQHRNRALWCEIQMNRKISGVN